MTTYKPPCIVCGGEGCATSCASPRFVITTVGTYLGSVDFNAALRQLEIERDEARKERDDYHAEIERLHERIEQIEAAHVEALRLSSREAAEALPDKDEP